MGLALRAGRFGAGLSEERHDRLSEALDQALSLEGAEQAEFLSVLRREQPDLIEEVEGLLRVDQDLETDFLGKPMVAGDALFDEPTSADWEQVTEPVLGDASTPSTIGPYHLQEVLGTGGMGKVFLAEQKEPLQRTVALKLIRSGFRDAHAKARFDVERRLLARLEHPNIGRILDAGTTEGGFPYFALELVHGEPLDEYCNRRRLSINERLEIMISICRGVEHAHRKQIIHRDLKPSNILVAEIDGRPVPKIIDFGIAESLDHPRSNRTSGSERTLVGTPSFMSPEALGGAEDLDTRTDVYSLGILLYLLLAGQRPFEGRTVADLHFRVIQEDPPAPSTRLSTLKLEDNRTQVAEIADQRNITVQQLRRRLKGDLDWITLRAVARDQEERYGSADALADDLERYLKRMPITARPATRSYRIGKWVRRNRGAVVAAALLGLLAVGLLIQDVRARSRTERLTRASEELTREIERVEWRLRVAHLLPVQDLSPELESIREGMRRLKASIPSMYEGARGPGAYALGRGAMSLGDWSEAREHLEQAWELGYRRPEVALALGSTLGQLYEDRLDAIDRLMDRDSRDRQRQLAEQNLRDPALEMLKRAQSDLTISELLAARIAFYQGDLDLALEKSRSAASLPWLYEARFLEAQILQRQAARLDTEDRAKVTELLDDAEDAALKGLEVARNSPEGYLRLCRVRNRLSSHSLRYSLGGVAELHERSLKACVTARQILPGMVGAHLEEASAWLNLADHEVWDLHKDPSESLAKLNASLDAVATSRETLERFLPEIELTRGTADRMLATYLEQAGEDARGAIDSAIAHFERAAELQPDDYFVNTELSLILAFRAHFDRHKGTDPTAYYLRSEEYARKAIEIDADRILGHTYLAQTLLRRSEYQVDVGLNPIPLLDEAAAALEIATQVDSHRISVLSTQTAVFMVRGKWLAKTGRDPSQAFRSVIDFTELSLSKHPNAPFPRLMKGQGYLGLARYALAKGEDPSTAIRLGQEWYGKGLEALPSFPGPHIELAKFDVDWALYELIAGRSPVAAAERGVARARRALELDGERADAMRVHGAGEAILAAWWAEQDLKRSGEKQLSPRSSALFDSAMGFFEDALEVAPDVPKHHLELARGLWLRLKVTAELGVDDELRRRALKHARHAYELDPSSGDALALEGAILMLAEEDRGLGEQKIRAAIEQDGNLAQLWGSRLPQ